MLEKYKEQPLNSVYRIGDKAFWINGTFTVLREVTILNVTKSTVQILDGNDDGGQVKLLNREQVTKFLFTTQSEAAKKINEILERQLKTHTNIVNGIQEKIDRYKEFIGK